MRRSESKLAFARHVAITLCFVAAVTAQALDRQSGNSDSSQSQSSQSSSGSSASSSDSPSSDNNAFPESESRKAAEAKAKAAKNAQGADNPASPPSNYPQTSSSASDNAPDTSGGSDNAFPEAASENAAKAAASTGTGGASTTSDSGVSSSSDYDRRATGGRDVATPNVSMTHIHRKDPTTEDIQVGTFYLQSGDYPGAYARFKEAVTLHPENVDAVFGLAEAARRLKKDKEAEDNYRLYLDVVTSGAKARDARKALASLEKK